jgi:hypothetical protein
MSDLHTMYEQLTRSIDELLEKGKKLLRFC